MKAGNDVIQEVLDRYSRGEIQASIARNVGLSDAGVLKILRRNNVTIVNLLSRCLADRFWEKVNKGHLDTCWEWSGYQQPRPFNYGVLGVCGRTRRAHRIAWMLTYGEIPNGLFVLHHCDNPPCYNPAHLFLGTDRENTEDKVSKGRHRGPVGERNSKAKLTGDDVVLIRKIAANGAAATRIGKAFGVGQTAILDIIHRRRWRHIP